MTDVNQLITEHLDIWTSAIEKKSSAGRGDGRSVSLYGIKKLRELILELAVRGKLVAQDELEGRGQDVLNAIAKRRKALLASGAIKKSKRRNQESNVPFSVPKNWSWAELDDLTPWQLTDGDWIEKKDQDPQGGVRLIQLADVGVVEFLDKSERFVNEATFHRLKCTQLNEGDILIARLPNPIGRACTFPDIGQTAITAVDVAILRPTEEVSRRYLVWAINSNMARLQVESFGKGATRFRISTGNLKTVNIPVPPLAEQHRIVAKVDELMALCDALERQAEDSLKAHQTLVETCLATLTNSQSPEDLTQNWTRIEAHFDTLFTTEESVAAFEASIYELAIKGVLVDQQPNDEPTATFLKSIGIQPEEAGAGLPATWSKCSLGELGKITGGGTPKKTDQRFWGGEIPWVSPKDMKVDYISDSTDKITEAAVAGSAVKLIESGSLLFVVRGMILAHSFPVAITETQVTINQDMKAIDLSSFDQAYVLLMMKGLKREVLSRVDRSSHGTCKLVSGKLWSVGLPIPPRAEQSRIAAKVQVLVEICADLRERLQSAAKKQTELADTLSAKVH